MRRVVLSLVVVSSLACGSDTTGPSGSKELRLISGANATDTVDAFLSQPLIVEVHDPSGAVAPAGTVVRFTALPASKGTELTVEPLGTNSYGTFAAGATDQAGRTGVFVRLGTVAGPARVEVSVPTLDLTDTVQFTANPGAAVRITLSPLDTALYVGASFQLRGGVTDQFGNVRPGAPAFSFSSGGISVSDAGRVTASSIGRYSIQATATGVSTTPTSFSVAVSVVPQGHLVAGGGRINGPLVLFDMDGSHFKVIDTVDDGGVGVHPESMPNGTGIVFTGLIGGVQTLQVADTTGAVHRFFSSPPSTMTHEAEPAPTQDGQWLYFSAFDSRCVNGLGYCLFRSRLDGSNIQLFSQIAGGNPRPAPSPDGSRVAYRTSGGQMHVFDVATQTVSSWTLPAQTMAWSPDGTQIAVNPPTGSLAIVKADGSSTRSFASFPSTNPRGLVSWSHDGRYLLAQASNGRYNLVDTVDGTVLPLEFTAGYTDVTIR